MEDNCDIIIIGAGIAGTACALRCARAGLSVLLLERAEIPGSKNLSGGRLYTHALAELLPQFHLTAPLERRITHESLSLLTPDGATTFSSLQPGGESWSVLRARFDPWLVAEAEKKVSNASPVRRWMRCMKKTAGCVVSFVVTIFSAPVMWCWQKVPTASWLNVTG